MKELSSQELRIGNYVEYGGVINKVYLLSHLYFQVESTDIPTFTANKNRAAQPIPLTEEWLLKFGFEKQHKELSHLSPLNLPETFNLPNSPFSYSQGKLILTTGTGDFCVYIEYVHQLQNLYFALTGEELTLEP